MKSVYFTHQVHILSTQRVITGTDVWDFIDFCNLKLNAIPLFLFHPFWICKIENKDSKPETLLHYIGQKVKQHRMGICAVLKIRVLSGLLHMRDKDVGNGRDELYHH